MTERLIPRLELLVNPRADKDARHRSLRTAIAWSVRMLSPEARRFFARLAVFQGGWDSDGAAQVCMAIDQEDDLNAAPAVTLRWSAFDLLERLLSESLLIAEERDGTMRFRMLETLREFAWEQLPPREQERLRRRHATYWMTYGEDLENRLNGPELGSLLNRLEAERANLNAALTWCQEPPATDLSPSPLEIGLRIVGAIWRFWDMRGSVQEGRQIAERLLAQAGPEVAPAVKARAHTMVTAMAKSESDFAGALAHSEQALEQWRQAGNVEGAAAVLGNLGALLSDQGRLEAARERYEEGLAIVRALGVPRRIATFCNNLGSLQRMMGDFDAAQANLEESLELRREIGDRRAIFSTLNNMAALAHHRQEFAAAVRTQEEALAIARDLEDRFAVAVSLVNLANTYLSLQDYSNAHACFTESLQLHTAVGSRLGQAYALGGLAAHAAASDCPERAGTLLGAEQSLRQAIDAVMPPQEQELFDAAFTHLAADARFLDALQKGRSLPLDAVLSLAQLPL